MPQDTLIQVEGVSKKFCTDLKHSLWYGVQDIGRGLRGKAPSEELRRGEFWAVKDVSFEVKRGECLGLIGHNGAGKSTLLKMLNGLIRPDKGHIRMNGRVSALIELGTGFNPILTGRENVYVNGAILGFSKAEIDRKMDAIIDFAEIEDFIDAPVRGYSSGMKVRLGFAVAAHMEPDILLVDEVLAVGDVGFVLKCFNVIDDLLERAAVILVSHSMPQVSRVATQGCMLSHGKVLKESKALSEVLELYYSQFDSKKKNFSRGNGEVELLSFEVEAEEYINGEPIVEYLSDMVINIRLRIKEIFAEAVPYITISDKEQRPVGIATDYTTLKAKQKVTVKGGMIEYAFSVTYPKLNLSAGTYFFTFGVSETRYSKPLLRLQGFKKLQIRDDEVVWPPIKFQTIWK